MGEKKSDISKRIESGSNGSSPHVFCLRADASMTLRSFGYILTLQERSIDVEPTAMSANLWAFWIS